MRKWHVYYMLADPPELIGCRANTVDAWDLGEKDWRETREQTTGLTRGTYDLSGGHIALIDGQFNEIYDIRLEPETA